MAGSQSNGPGSNQNNHQNRQGPGYHYEYNYNYNFNGGPSPRPPKRDNGWGEWIGIIVLFLLPFGITQVIAVIWAIRKILNKPYIFSFIFKITAHSVKDDSRPGVADMDVIINRRPAGVHFHLAGLDGHKLLFFAGHGVVNFHKTAPFL